MSIVEHTHVPAGWYTDGVVEDSLRWWDGTDWTNDVRSLSAPTLVPVPPVVVEYVPGESSAIEPTLYDVPDDVSGLLTSVPERAASDQLHQTAALTRRQLREMLGGPLVTEAPTDQ